MLGYCKHIFVLIFCLISAQFAYAQGCIISGIVLDDTHNDTLSYVNLTFTNPSLNTTTDVEGQFYLVLEDSLEKKIVFETSGYETYSFDIDYTKPLQHIIIRLKPQKETLKGTVITSKKTKYSNKNNPAVELMRKVIDRKDSLRYDYNKGSIQQTYDKIQLGLINPPRILTHNFLTKKYNYVFENLDTNRIQGAALLPVYLEEKFLKNYYRTKIPIAKSELLAEKKVTFNEKFISNDMINNYLTHIYRDIDVYEDQSLILTNMFTSPIASTGPLYYKYYLSDTTVNEDADTIIRLAFEPRNKIDFLFNGYIKIRLKDYALIHADLGMSKHINLNFVKNYRIAIVYDTLQNQYYKRSTHQMMEFGDKSFKNSVYAERLNMVYHIDNNAVIADEKFKNAQLVDTAENYFSSPEMWQAMRPVPLSETEQKAYANMEMVSNTPHFNNVLKIGRLLFGGYYRTKYLEIGPVSTFYSYNDVEGWRWRLGGRTPIDLTRFWQSEFYGAFGVRDQKFKYFWSGTLALSKDKTKYLTHYPYNHIKLTVQSDTRLPGSNPGFIQEGNIVESFKRGVNDKYIFNQYVKGEYVREFSNHIRINPFVNFSREQPVGNWNYVRQTDLGLDTLEYITKSEIGFNLRWAPNEKIMQGRTNRTNLTNEWPIIDFGYTLGVPNVFNSDYSYQIFKLAVFKRVYLGQFGFLDSRIGGTYVSGENLPYTLLDIPRANQAITYSSTAYSLMNYMEFVSDKSAYINLHYHPGGLILNKIPLIKKLKFREVFGLKVLYGELSDKNNPLKNLNVLQYPTDDQGRFTTHTFTNEPYVEVSAGLTNILKVGRVDAVWRLTHLGQPNISHFGIRVGAYFDF